LSRSARGGSPRAAKRIHGLPRSPWRLSQRERAIALASKGPLCSSVFGNRPESNFKIPSKVRCCSSLLVRTYVIATISALGEVSEAMQFALAARAVSEQRVGFFEIVAVAKAGVAGWRQPSTEGDQSEGPYWLRYRGRQVRQTPRHRHGQAICLQKPAAVSRRSRLGIMVERSSALGQCPAPPSPKIGSPSVVARRVARCTRGASRAPTGRLGRQLTDTMVEHRSLAPFAPLGHVGRRRTIGRPRVAKGVRGAAIDVLRAGGLLFQPTIPRLVLLQRFQRCH
jgi:hypothetical protein